jgi:hypothetical protein
MASQLATVSAFVEGAPPGEVSQSSSPLRSAVDLHQARRCNSWYSSTPPASSKRLDAESLQLDIKALTIENPSLVSQLGPAFEKYNEEQFATVKLPGSSQNVSPGWQDTGEQ